MSEFPKLFVTDLDGTALGGGFEPYARFPDSFSEFLDRLSDKGCQWAINTTWDPNGQWQLVLSSSVKSRPAYLMGELGYKLVKVNNGHLDFVEPYTSEINSAVSEINERSLLPLIKDICGEFSPERIHFYGHLFQFNAIEKDHRELEKFFKKYNSMENDIICLYNEGQFVAYPEILKKGKSLTEVIKLNNLTPEDVVIAGDEVADISMMHCDLCAFPICPDNAHPNVKKHVQKMNGEIGEGHSGIGIINAFNKLAKKNEWNW